MADNIEQLSIEIIASSDKASTAIDNLCGKLNTLSKRLNSVSTKKLNSQLSQASTLMNNLAKSSRASTSNVTSSFGSLNNALGSISSSLNSANRKINSFFGSLKSTQKETKNFAQTAGLLYARFFLLIRGVKKLGDAVGSSMNYIETLNYFNSAFKQIDSTITDEWEDLGYESAKAYGESLKDGMKKVTQQMSGFFPDDSGNLIKSKGAVSLGLDPEEVMKYQAQFGQMASSMGIASDKATQLSEVLVKIGADLASVKNLDFDKVWGDMASGLVGMSRTLDKYGVNIRNVNMQEKLAELGINAKVSALNQQDKALLRTIILLDSTRYAWGDLSNTLNQPANQMRLLSANVAQLGRMIGNILLPIVAKVLPYINAFVIALQRLFGWIAKILHIDLSGLAPSGGIDNGSLGDLADNADEASEALDGANNSAKKLKHQLLGLDELNVINSQDGSQGGGIGGVGGLLGGAFNDAIDEYLKAWEDAFNQLRNKAEKIADDIQAFFMRLTKPIRYAWNATGQWIIKKWKEAFSSLSDLFKSVAESFWKVWEQDKTTKIFENLFNTLGLIGSVISNISTNLKIAWENADSGTRIFEGIRDIVLVVSEHIRLMAVATDKWSEELDFEPLFESMARFVESMIPLFDTLYGIIEDFYTQVLLPLGKWTIEKGLPDLLDVLSGLLEKIDWDKLRSNLSDLWDKVEPFAERVGEGLILFIEDVGTSIADFVNSEKFERFLDKFGDFLDDISAEDVQNALWKLVDAIILLKVTVGAFKVAKGLSDFVVIVERLSKIKNIGIISELGTSLASLGGIVGLNTMDLGIIFGAGTAGEIGLTLATGIGEALIAGLAGFEIGKKIGKLITGDTDLYDSFKFTGSGGFFDTLFGDVGNSDNKIKTIVEDLKDCKKAWDEMARGEETPIWLKIITNAISPVTALSSSITALKKTKEDLDGLFQPIVDSWNTFSEWWAEGGVSTWYEQSVKPTFNKSTWDALYAPVKDSLQGKWNELEAWWNGSGFMQWWNKSVTPYFKKDTWDDLYAPIKDSLKNKWEEFTKWWNSNGAVKWFNTYVSPTFSKDKWTFSGIKEGLVKAWEDAVNAIKGVWNSFAQNFNQNTTITIPSMNIGGKQIGGQKFELPKLPTFANGGFPEDGLFFANHSELVGSFSNGKTAVANNSQIIDGIASGVASANAVQNELLREQNNILLQILEKKTGITSDELFNSVRESNNVFKRRTGISALV